MVFPAAFSIRISSSAALVTLAVMLLSGAIFGQEEPKAPATLPTTRPLERSHFTRLAPRETKTDAEYKQIAAELRAAYSKPTAEWPKPTLDEGVELRELAPLPKPVYPESNPYTEEKALLGQQLFFDVRLSGSGQIACASCHDPELGWSDGRALAYGHKRQLTKRNSPALFTAGFEETLFWDGRVKTLEDQAREPIFAGEEMAGESDTAIVERLGKVPGYRKQFKTVFGSEEVTMDRVAQAVATFERSIVRAYGFSKFDRFLRGDADALSDDAVRGLHLFRTDARCLNCHNGPLLTDGKFHDVGLSYYGRTLEDLGRYKITKQKSDVGAFRTPTLRNIGRTGPYMHNGLFELEGVLNMYNAGMPTLKPKAHQLEDPLFPVKSPLLKPLGFNRQDLADLKAFMESLNERRLRIRPRIPSDDGKDDVPAPGAPADGQADDTAASARD